MNDAEGINFKVAVPTDREGSRLAVGATRGFRHNNPNLEDIMKFIQGLPVPLGDKESLSKIARKVPHGALANFRSNYVKYLKKESRS
jgi:predicted glycosyltransferase